MIPGYAKATVLAICVCCCVGSEPATLGPPDEAVLNAVLVHFIGDVAEDAGQYRHDRGKVILHKRNPEHTGLLDQTLNIARYRNAHSEAVADVVNRAQGKGIKTKPISYERLKLDKRVQIVDIAPMIDYFTADWAENEKVKGFLTCHAPGYSKDGRTAVVVAFVEPSEHGAVVVYYLKLDGEKWIVKWRQYLWYT